jgi:oxygen-independent coproporphyrinogen-3 oxidase
VETSGRNKTTQFIEALLDEVSIQAEDHTIEPRTIYLGGGTPSALGIHQLERLLRGLHERLDLHQIEEWTIEINPATVSPEKARLLRANGISRVSMGVQAWDDTVLAALGRNHSAGQAERTFDTLRAAGFGNINIDLIFAVPGQTRGQWLKTLEKTVSLRPEHVSCYCLTYEEDTEFFRKLTRGEFRQDNDWDADLFELAMDALGAAGFDHYEISNYSQPGRQSAHNQAYWRGDDYLGFGPSAFSTVGNKRWQNVPDTASYIAAISGNQTPALEAEPLDQALRNREAIAFGLRTHAGVPASALLGHETEVREFRELGLLKNRAGRIVLTRRGKLLADAVAQAFV